MLHYRFGFLYPVVIDGCRLDELDLTATAVIQRTDDDGWYVDEWVVAAEDGEITIAAKLERDPAKRTLLDAIEATWRKNETVHTLEIERKIRADNADDGEEADYRYEDMVSAGLR